MICGRTKFARDTHPTRLPSKFPLAACPKFATERYWQSMHNQDVGEGGTDCVRNLAKLCIMRARLLAPPVHVRRHTGRRTRGLHPDGPHAQVQQPRGRLSEASLTHIQQPLGGLSDRAALLWTGAGRETRPATGRSGMGKGSALLAVDSARNICRIWASARERCERYLGQIKRNSDSALTA